MGPGDPTVMQHYPASFDTTRIRQWIDWNTRLYDNVGYGLWTIRDRVTGNFIGDCGLTPQPVNTVTEIELGYHLLTTSWHQGLATEAATACRDYARDVLHAPRVVAIVAPENTASRAVAERVGLSLDPAAQARDGHSLVLIQTLPTNG